MMRAYWGKLSQVIDALSLRERALIFAAAAFVLAALANAVLLEPLLARQKALSQQIVQQQEKIKEVHAQIELLLQAQKSSERSPQRQRLMLLKQQLATGEAYLQERKDRLVPAEKMASLLEQVLTRNGRLQLVGLQTLPMTPLVGEPGGKNGGAQLFRHGVQITVRGGYADMLEYLAALERLPEKMFWGMVKLNVVKYPVAELTLTVYTLSMDETWLRV